MKKIFMRFVIENKQFRNLLKGQSKNTHHSFNFTDMSVKKTWDFKWKTTRKGYDGVISIIPKNVSEQIWEMKYAKEENIPIIAISGNNYYPSIVIPDECGYIRLMIGYDQIFLNCKGQENVKK